MRTASAEMKAAMQEQRAFQYAADLTFANGDTLTLTEDDLIASNCGIDNSSGGSSFPVGVAMCRCLTLTIANFEEQYRDYDFFGCKIVVTASMQFDSRTETLDLGQFTVTEPEQYGTTITITAYDDMYKADKEYVSTLVYPATLEAMYAEICTQCGFLAVSSRFLQYSYQVPKKPEAMSCRQALAYIAQLACGNVIMDYNKCLIVSYVKGRFTPEPSGSSILLNDIFTQRIGTDDIVITGVRVSSGNVSHLDGTDGYVLDITNPFTEGQEQYTSFLLGITFEGLTFRAFEISTPSDPLIEIGDVVYVGDNQYCSVVTDIDFRIHGATTIKCTADDPIRNSSKAFTAQTATYQRMRKLIEDEKTARQIVEEALAEAIAEKSGLYTTQVQQQGGSYIYYMHDAPDLSDSQVVWKMTRDAFAVTTQYDGDDTVWTAGLTVDGNLIANILSANGINADWIRSGTLTLGGDDNVRGMMSVLDENAEEFALFTKDGLSFLQHWEADVIDLRIRLEEGGIRLFVDDLQQETTEEVGRLTFSWWDAYNFGAALSAESLFFNIGYRDNDQISSAILVNNGLNPISTGTNRYTEKIIFYEEPIFTKALLVGSAKYKAEIRRHTFTSTSGSVNGIGVPAIYVDDEASVKTLTVRDGKNRLVETKNHGERLLYAYETATPYFGDIGTAQIDENGESVVSIGDIFGETVNTAVEYNVFLQKEGQGDLWVETKEHDYFIVKGTPHLKYSWELKAVQCGYENYRIQDYSLTQRMPRDYLEEEMILDLNQYDNELRNIDTINSELAAYDAEMEELFA